MDKGQLETVRLVISEMIRAAGVADATSLARKAGLAHTTLTRLFSEDAINWSISANTWQKLSAASGVPVTFLGDKIVIPSFEPGDRYIVKDPVEIRLLRFWNLLGPEEKDFVVSLVDSWAERLTRQNRKSQ